MAKIDVIKSSYDAMQALERTVRSLSYLSSIIPAEDDHAALLHLLSDKLDHDFSLLRSEMLKLSPDLVKTELAQ